MLNATGRNEPSGKPVDNDQLVLRLVRVHELGVLGIVENVKEIGALGGGKRASEQTRTSDEATSKQRHLGYK